MIRAKFTCTNKEPTPTDPTVGGVTFLPVVSGSEENREFFDLTPSGSIMLATLNPSVFEQFQPGQEYYVDFSPA